MASKEVDSMLNSKAVTHAKLPDTTDDDIEALLSPKANPSEDMLFESPTAEGRLEAALTKIGRLEDMDVQLRSQLEKLIAQRNQLNGDKAARDIEIQHLQAQVDLLEAEAAGQHRSDSRPNSPRDSEADRLASHTESLQANNTRLQEQVAQAVATAASQSDRITLLQTSLTDSSSSLEAAEKLGQQAEQELVTQRRLLTQQASQLEALQQKLGEQSAKAASAAAAEADLQQKLRLKEDEVTQRSREFEDELEGLQKLAAAAQKQEETLQSQVASSQAAKEELQQTVVSQQQQLHNLSNKLDTEAAQKASLQQLLQAAITQAQNAQQELESRQATSTQAQKQDAASMTDRPSPSRDIGTVTDSDHLMQGSSGLSEALSQAGFATAVAEQHDDSAQVERLTEQLSETQAELVQMKKNTAELERTAELEQQLSAQAALATQHRLTVSLLETQAAKSETQMDALRDAYKQLQQQLGERTIVLGQKAHQIAELTLQLNQARGLPASKDASQGIGQEPITSADQLKGDTTLAHPGQNSAQPSATKAGHNASAEDEPPFTPLPDPQHPQRPLFTPSDSESKSAAGTNASSTPGSAATVSTGRQDNNTPGSIPASAGTEPVSTQTQASDSAAVSQPAAEKLSQGKSEQTHSTLHSPRTFNAKVGELPQGSLTQYAGSKSPTLLHQPTAADKDATAAQQGQLGLQLSPHQSHLSSPSSQANDRVGHDSSDTAVLHVNSVFDRSEEDEQGNSSSAPEEEEEGERAMNCQLGVADAQLVQKLQGQVADLKKQLGKKPQGFTLQGEAESEELRLRLTDTKQALRSAIARAEDAEKDLQEALGALQQAETLLAQAMYRKDAAELVALAAGCVAAFLGAAGMTVYYLH